MMNLSSVLRGSGLRAGMPGSVLLRIRWVMAMPCAAHNTVNSNITGMKAGTLWYQVQFGLPPMSIGQSWIMKYHVPKEASVVPVIPNMNAAMPRRVRFTR